MSVYFLQAKSGPIKIGYSRIVSVRTRILSTLTHEETSLIGVVEHGSFELEARLHRVLAANRIRGEWFSPAGPAGNVLDFIRAARWSISQYEFLVGLPVQFMPEWFHDPEARAALVVLCADQFGSGSAPADRTIRCHRYDIERFDELLGFAEGGLAWTGADKKTYVARKSP